MFVKIDNCVKKLYYFCLISSEAIFKYLTQILFCTAISASKNMFCWKTIFFSLKLIVYLHKNFKPIIEILCTLNSRIIGWTVFLTTRLQTPHFILYQTYNFIHIIVFVKETAYFVSVIKKIFSLISYQCICLPLFS